MWLLLGLSTKRILPAVAVDRDEALRSAAFAYLAQLIQRSGGPVRRPDLESFAFEERPVRLLAPQQGIWTPRGFPAALSILTTYAPRPDLRPYRDDPGPDGYPRYKWRGADPYHHDNVSLRRAMELGRPLVWFVGIAPGIYRANFPVWLVGEEPGQHQFVVALDETMRSGWHAGLVALSPFDPIRRYAERIVLQRLHQRPFRDRVLLAYQTQCALCRLRHRPLLDAAHIKEDAEGGEPIVPNGVAMCAIHHRAFDAHVLGLRPDYVVEIRADVLVEHDGPTLQHALQGLHGEVIALPRRRAERPSLELLEERYERFRAAG
jgi:putative restriction endonuclease